MSNTAILLKKEEKYNKGELFITGDTIDGIIAPLDINEELVSFPYEDKFYSIKRKDMDLVGFAVKIINEYINSGKPLNDITALFNWNNISSLPDLSEELVDEYSYLMDWDIIAEHWKLTKERFIKYHDNLPLEYAVHNPTFDIQWIKDIHDTSKVATEILIKYSQLSDEEIRKIINSDYIKIICKHQKLSLDIINDYWYQLDWINIIENNELSDELIRRILDDNFLINKKDIIVALSVYQQLELNTIKDYMNLWSFALIINFQQISYDTIIKFIIENIEIIAPKVINTTNIFSAFVTSYNISNDKADEITISNMHRYRGPVNFLETKNNEDKALYAVLILLNNGVLHDMKCREKYNEFYQYCKQLSIK